MEFNFFKKKIQSTFASGVQVKFASLCLPLSLNDFFKEFFCVCLCVYLMQYSDTCLTFRRLLRFVCLGKDEIWEFVYTLVDATVFPQ